MSSIIAYKVAIVVLLAVSGASLGGTTYYFQQRTNDLNNRISSLSDQVSSSNGQVSTLNNQISQLQSLNSQLQSQVTSLQNQLATLTRNLQPQAAVVSNGDIRYDTHGGLVPPGYVNFTVPSNAVSASLNVSFTVGADINGGVFPTRAVVLSQAQYSLYGQCNCFYFGNTTLPTTWVSPWISGGCNCYSAQITGLDSGIWILLFQVTPSAAGQGFTWVVTEKAALSTVPQTGQTTQKSVPSQGTIALTGYSSSCYTYNQTCLTGGVAYINFTVPSGIVSALLNVSFSASSSANPCGSVCPRLSLLSPAQYVVFIRCNCLDTGNYTALSTTWSSPFSPSYTAQITILRPGLWVLAFQLSPGQTAPLPYGTYFSIGEKVELTATVKT